jgi:hypothetical protein
LGGCCTQHTPNKVVAAAIHATTSPARLQAVVCTTWLLRRLLQAALNSLTQAAAVGSSQSAQQFYSDGCNRQRTTNNAEAVARLQAAHKAHNSFTQTAATGSPQSDNVVAVVRLQKAQQVYLGGCCSPQQTTLVAHNKQPTGTPGGAGSPSAN